MDKLKNNKIIWTLVLVLLAVSAYAGSYNPETYWGYVYVEGALASSGTVLTVESTSTGELFANQTLPYDAGFSGSYSIIINFDDGYTAADEGAGLNEVLTWKVDGVATTTPAAGADIAESGGTNNNFLVYGVLNPVMTAVLQDSNNVILGQSMDLTVILNNSGSGSGNATLASIDDSNVTTDMPKTIYVGANNTNQTTVSITPSICGEYNPTLTINYYNLAGSLIGNLTEEFSFNVTGADLILDPVVLSDSNPTEGDTITITSNVINNGTANITGFTASFYYDSTLISTTTSTDVLEAGEIVEVSSGWDAVLGASLVNITITTAGDECSSVNNEQTASITVEEVVEVVETSGGSSGGSGVSTTGRSSNTECNDTIDNDGDELIDLDDPGCESLNDDNETHEIIEKDETLGEQEINQTVDEEIDSLEEEGIGGFVTSKITGFAIQVKESKTNWLLVIIVLILCGTLTYKLLSGVKIEQSQTKTGSKGLIPGFRGIINSKSKNQDKINIVIGGEKKVQKQENAVEQKVKKEKPEQKQKTEPKLKFDFRHNDDQIYAKKQETQPKQMVKAEKPAVIQKSIKISSKKDIIDKLKEVYEEND